MKKFTLSCVHRSSGEPCVETVEAVDERSAFNIVADKGLMVAKVLQITSVEQKPAQTEQYLFNSPSFDSQPKNAGLTDDIYESASIIGTIFPIILIFAGIILMLSSAFMETSTGYLDRVHNVGLLNRQTILMIAGGFLLTCGIISHYIQSSCISICKAVRLNSCARNKETVN